MRECNCCFFFQAEDGIRDLVRSRGLGDVYKRQALQSAQVDAGDLASQVQPGTSGMCNADFLG